MSDMPSPKQEPAHTYFVQGREELDEEYKRLHTQSRLLASKAGIPLAEQPDPSRFHRVLDVGCGTGDWLIRAAVLYPSIEQLIGIDINPTTIHFAESMAEEAGVAGRVRFQMMDALRMLEFPDEYFDLVSVRFGMSWLRTWDWPNLLRRMHRVLKPKGVARLVDAKSIDSNAPAFNRFWDLGIQATYQSGHLAVELKAREESMTKLFPELLETAGFRDVQRRTYPATYRAGEPGFGLFAEDMRLIVSHAAAFLQKWLRIDGYQQLAEQVDSELKSPGFVCEWPIEVAWATC